MTRILSFSTALMLALPQAALAQDRPGFMVDVHSRDTVRLAVAAPYTPTGDPGGIAATIRQVIEHDLGLTGHFTILPPDTHLAKAGPPDPAHLDPAPWALLKTSALIQTQVRRSDDPLCGAQNICVDLYVYDVTNAHPLAAKRLKAPADSPRALAHATANLAFSALTGAQGWFDSLLAAVREVDGHKEIALVGLDGEDIRAVTRNGSVNLSPTFTPDHSRILWTSFRRGESDLYAKNLLSGEVQTLSARPGAEIGPAVSPDGRLVAIAIATAADTDIWLLDAQTGDVVRRLTQGGGIDANPSFSPDGKTIVFASERLGGTQIFTVPVEGGEPVRVTRTGGMFSDPVFSPDGSRIAYVGQFGGRFDILTSRPDGSGLVRITENMGDNENPDWSPDGRYLVFNSNRRGKQQLWISTADGRFQAPITASGGWTQPTWGP